MRELLLIFVKHFGFLYESPDRRIVDSGTPHARAAEAYIELRSRSVRWVLAKERFSLVLSVGAVKMPELFSTEIVQQYVDDLAEMPGLHLGKGLPGLAWIEANVDAIESLFADDQRARQVIDELIVLSKANADARWGPLPRREP